MPSDDLTPADLAALVILMAENREVSNPELAATYHLTVTGKQLSKLRDQKLVEVARGPRGAHLLTLSEQGWARCRAELGGPVPVRVGAAGAGMYALLAALGRYLDAENVPLADFARPAPARPVDVAPKPVSRPRRPAVDTTSAQPGGLEQATRRAYAALAERPGAWVSLTDLRAALAPTPKRDVDAALRRLDQEPDVMIISEANQKGLTKADREAAVVIGGRKKHHLAIEAR